MYCMIGIKKKYIHYLLALILCVLFSHTRTFAEWINSFDQFFGIVSEDLFTFSPTDKNADNMISLYCSSVMKAGAFKRNDNDGFVYDPAYSSFVYLLCKKHSITSKPKDYFKRTTFVELWLTDNGYCPSSFDCAFATIVPKLFNDIMTDYTNIKEANLYGLIGDFTMDKEIEDQANVYSQAFFGVDICQKKDRSYPSTCRDMKSYIRKAKNMMSKLDILSWSAILSMKPIKKEGDCSAQNTTRDLFYCWLFDTWASFFSFVNLSYNELFYYRLFMAYYLLTLQKNPGILAENDFLHNYDKILKTFSTQYMWSKSALSLTFRMLRDVYVSFPFHIGFLMYQEDLDGFGVSLAGIAPPIYTLHDKLRNVQKSE
jgi:hypothetical protein